MQAVNHNDVWNNVLSNLPQYDAVAETGETVNREIASNYYSLLPEARAVYTYEDSLTAPECNEIVNWIVMQNPVTVSSEAVANFAESQHNHLTYRNTQPLNGRVVTSSEMSGTQQ